MHLIFFLNFPLDPVLTPVKWSGVRKAMTFGASCYKNNTFTLIDVLNIKSELDSVNYTVPPESEDCLFLNIYTPMDNAADAKRLNLPVMFWIHGGGFIMGDGASYHGGMLAAKHNFVVVTINYRLGIFGFFNIPGTDMKGNYGMLDQLAAMKWVKKNIRDFGGDPDKITIFGESAGAISVSLQLLSPLSKGLFSAAIAQSGPPFASWQSKHKSDSDEFFRSIGCLGDLKTQIECARKVPVSAISGFQRQLVSTFRFGLCTPTVDGHFIVDDVQQMIKERRLEVSSVPLMIGFNLQEGTMFTPPHQNKTTFHDTVRMYLPEVKNHTVDLLTATTFEYRDWETEDNDTGAWFKSTSDFVGDTLFIIGTVNFADYWSSAGGTAYAYKFTYHPTNVRIPPWGVAHLTEIDFVFGKAYYPPNHVGRVGFIKDSRFPYSEQDINMTKAVMDMWVNFAKSSSPGNGWPKYTDTEKEFMNIGSNMIVEKNLVHPRRMAFWNVLFPSLSNTNRSICDCKGFSPELPSRSSFNFDFSILLLAVVFFLLL